MIHEISLQDCLEVTAPPARVLILGALDDTVFVRICDVEQDDRRETHTEVAEISVSLPSLLEAVAILGADQDREHLRPLEREGQHETRLAGGRVTVAPAGLTSLVGAVTRHRRYTPQAEASAGPPVRAEGRKHQPGCICAEILAEVGDTVECPVHQGFPFGGDQL